MGWTDEDETVHQIDEKYIPSSSGGAMVVNITIEIVEDVEVVTADKTYDELNNALLSGISFLTKVESDATGAAGEYSGAVSNMVSKLPIEVGVYAIGFSFASSGLIICTSTNEWMIVG